MNRENRRPRRRNTLRARARAGRRNADRKQQALWSTVATASEVFSDGAILELVGSRIGDAPQLLLWDGAKETIARSFEHNGRVYDPVPLTSDLLRELMLPTGSLPCGTTGELVAELCGILTNLGGASEKVASIVARSVCCSWMPEALSVAPALVISGPDTQRADRLLRVLRCLCRHSLYITHVTPTGLCSLPNRLHFTLLINQPTISEGLLRLLRDIRRRDTTVPFRGSLLNLFGLQCIHSDSWAAAGSDGLLDVPLVPGGSDPAPFDEETQLKLAREFQPKLLRFRLTKLSLARAADFDVSKFDPAVGQLASSMFAATPDDPELQAEVLALLRNEDDQARERRWTDVDAICTEAVIAASNKSSDAVMYIAQIAAIAQEIARRRSEDGANEVRDIQASELGKWLRRMGFAVEQRDQRGRKLRLTSQVLEHAQELARALRAPKAQMAGPSDQEGSA